MRFYPEIPSQRRSAIARDVAVLLLLALFAWLGFAVYQTVDRLTVLGTGVKDAGSSVARGFERAADAVDETPVVGGELAESLREAGEGTGGNVAEFGRAGEERVHRLAVVLGLIVFGVPALLLLLQEAPPRVARVRALTAAGRALADGDVERRRLLAMRAAFSLPYAELLRYTADPFGDLAEGHYDALVAAVLEDSGLRAP
jgi:hypothetical protein